MMTYLQLVHRFGQSNKDYITIPLNWRVDLSWSAGWFSHVECIVCLVIVEISLENIT